MTNVPYEPDSKYNVELFRTINDPGRVVAYTNVAGERLNEALRTGRLRVGRPEVSAILNLDAFERIEVRKVAAAV